MLIIPKKTRLRARKTQKLELQSAWGEKGQGLGPGELDDDVDGCDHVSVELVVRHCAVVDLGGRECAGSNVVEGGDEAGLEVRVECVAARPVCLGVLGGDGSDGGDDGDIVGWRVGTGAQCVRDLARDHRPVGCPANVEGSWADALECVLESVSGQDGRLDGAGPLAAQVFVVGVSGDLFAEGIDLL